MNQSAFKAREKKKKKKFHKLRPALLARCQESLGGNQRFKEICVGLCLTQSSAQRPQPGKKRLTLIQLSNRGPQQHLFIKLNFWLS